MLCPKPAYDAKRVVWLIMPIRYDEVRNGRLDCLRHRANSTRINEGRTARQDLAERQIGKGPNSSRKVGGQLLWKVGHQHRPIAPDSACLRGLSEKVFERRG